MSGFDIFAWIVLVILIAAIVAVFCVMGALPGHIAKRRGHPQAQAVPCVPGFLVNLGGPALARDGQGVLGGSGRDPGPGGAGAGEAG